MSSTIHAVTFDSGDAGKLATFWSQVVDRPVDADATAEFASISGLPQLMFFKVPDGTPHKDVHESSVRMASSGQAM
ncbi:MAG TPA: VOC family protein [Pseudonocardiaceae bacterium]|nr:VOC family protein [Pseudonocardiaceae bacterium]